MARKGYTRAVIERAFITRSEESSTACVATQCETPLLHCFFYADEAHRVGRAADLHWARSLHGERAECYVTSSAGAKTGFSVAKSHDCVLDRQSHVSTVERPAS